MPKPQPIPYEVKSNSTVELLPQDDDGISDNTPRNYFRDIFNEYKKNNRTDWTGAFRSGSGVLYYTNCEALNSLDWAGSEKVTRMDSMFSGNQRLDNVPYFDTSNVTSAHSMFSMCINIKEIPAYDFSKATNVNSMFSDAYNIRQIHAFGFRVYLNISSCYRMTREAVVEVINNLGEALYGSQTLKLGTTLLSKLTEDDIAIATAKGWTVE